MTEQRVSAEQLAYLRRHRGQELAHVIVHAPTLDAVIDEFLRLECANRKFAAELAVRDELLRRIANDESGVAELGAARQRSRDAMSVRGLAATMEVGGDRSQLVKLAIKTAERIEQSGACLPPPPAEGQP